MPAALLIVDHGSRNAVANRTLEELAQILRTLRPGLIIEIAHMELASPSIEEGLEACVRRGADEVVVHPYMLVPGRHAKEDIPRMAREAAARFKDVKVRVTDPLGLDAKIGEVVLIRSGL